MIVEVFSLTVSKFDTHACRKFVYPPYINGGPSMSAKMIIDNN